ncbi:MAG: hypothetical protein J7485_12470 [Sphingobium sp.]|nr:hypothetical protein [Sphingobium sp.]
MATPGEETKKLARDVGQRSVGQLEAGLARIMGETGANNRWLLGALVLLNGGGIAVTAAETAWLDPRVLEGAISLLAMGAALAVLATLASALSSLVLSRQIGAASALWTEVASSGDVSETALKAAVKVRQTGLVTALVTLGIGFLSLVLFVGGVLTLASGLGGETAPEPEPAPTAQMNVGTPPLPARTPEPAAAATQEPAATPTPAPTPVPETKAPPPKPQPQRTPPRRAPRASETAPASSSSPAATPPPAAAPAPVQQPAPAPPTG